MPVTLLEIFDNFRVSAGVDSTTECTRADSIRFFTEQQIIDSGEYSMTARDTWIGNIRLIIHDEPDGRSVGDRRTYDIDLMDVLRKYPELAPRVRSMVDSALDRAHGQAQLFE